MSLRAESFELFVLPFAAMRYEEFISSYSDKTNDELLRLELDAQQLTPEASIALKNELAKRGLGSLERLEAFRVEENQRKKTLEKNPGNLFLTRYGIGRWYFGKADKSQSTDGQVERFRTTIFILVLYFPLIPTGTYVVQRKRGFMRGKIGVVEKLPLDWKQVLTVWAVAFACLLAVILMLKHL
jgi:hypothetical protein